MRTVIDISHTILTTERLILRPFQQSDLLDLYLYASVAGVGEMAGWKHHTSMEESQRVLDMFIEDKNVFALRCKQSGRVIGSVGLHACDSVENLQHICEIGYVLSREHWGRGLMTEAVRAVIRHCFETLGLEGLTVGHFTENHRSRRVIEKCGFRYLCQKQFHAKQLDGRILDGCYYLLTAQAWQADIQGGAYHGAAQA